MFKPCTGQGKNSRARRTSPQKYAQCNLRLIRNVNREPELCEDFSLIFLKCTRQARSRRFISCRPIRTEPEEKLDRGVKPTLALQHRYAEG
ncbi:hypothetical protein DPMN_004365 [Dreissena polymorpha]|uniref:Uncharacterized protein n=1 Tax=Dreissena polymorpha TaxID=45954 RepID=A0A9D4MRM1_DREPO|nr:hypothetical protein DPMN_004365 [Dreissena polymorpha]